MPAAARAAGLPDAGGRAVPVVEDRGEQRRRAPPPRWPAGPGPAGRARGPAARPAAPASPPPHRPRSPPVPDPDRQRVHERPRHPVRARPGASSGRTAPCRTPRHHGPPAPPAPAPTPRGTPSPGTPPAPAPAPAPAPPASSSTSSRASRRPGPVTAGVQQPERRRRLASRPPAGRRSTARAPPAAPPAGPAPRSRGTAAAPAAGRPPRPAAPHLPQQHVQAGVVLHQVMHLHQRQPPAGARLGGRRAPAAAAPGPGPSAAPPPPAAPARASAARPSASRHLGDRQPRLPPHHLHRLGAAPPRPATSGRCHAGRSPAAARRELRQPRPGSRTAARTAAGTHPRRPSPLIR